MAKVLTALQEKFAQLHHSRQSPLPTYVVEYHHHVLPYLHKHLSRSNKLRRSSWLLHKPSTAILHLDAYPDLLFPRGFDTDRLLDKDYVYDMVNTNTWLLPLAYAGYVDNIFWIRPPWSERIPDGDYRFRIGKDTNGVKVDITHEYFVGECLWAPTELISEQKECQLHVHTAAEFAAQRVDRQDIQQSFVLDIDLDFFSTQNPFEDIFTQKQLLMIRQLYDFQMANSPDGLLECAQRRQDQLDDLESIVSAFLHGGVSEDGIEYESISDAERAKWLALLIEDLDRDPPQCAVLTPELIHEAGCMMNMHSTVPEHKSSRGEISLLCGQVEAMLRAIGGRPKTVVISRSVQDNLVPRDDVQFILESVVETLRNVYGDTRIFIGDDIDRVRRFSVVSLDSEGDIQMVTLPEDETDAKT